MAGSFGLGIKDDCGCDTPAKPEQKCMRICEPVKMIPTPTALTCWSSVAIGFVVDEVKQVLGEGIRPHTHIAWNGAGSIFIGPSRDMVKDCKGFEINCGGTFSIDMWSGELWVYSPQGGGDKSFMMNVWS